MASFKLLVGLFLVCWIVDGSFGEKKLISPECESFCQAQFGDSAPTSTTPKTTKRATATTTTGTTTTTTQTTTTPTTTESTTPESTTTGSTTPSTTTMMTYESTTMMSYDSTTPFVNTQEPGSPTMNPMYANNPMYTNNPMYANNPGMMPPGGPVVPGSVAAVNPSAVNTAPVHPSAVVHNSRKRRNVEEEEPVAEEEHDANAETSEEEEEEQKRKRRDTGNNVVAPCHDDGSGEEDDDKRRKRDTDNKEAIVPVEDGEILAVRDPSMLSIDSHVSTRKPDIDVKMTPLEACRTGCAIRECGRYCETPCTIMHSRFSKQCTKGCQFNCAPVSTTKAPVPESDEVRGCQKHCENFFPSALNGLEKYCGHAKLFGCSDGCHMETCPMAECAAGCKHNATNCGSYCEKDRTTCEIVYQWGCFEACRTKCGNNNTPTVLPLMINGKVVDDGKGKNN